MKNRKFHMPSAYTVLILIIFLIAGVTHFIPDVKNVTFAQALTAPVAGFGKGMDVSLFVIILGRCV